LSDILLTIRSRPSVPVWD